MATLFADGFDMYLAVADMLTPVGQWTVVGGGTSILTGASGASQFSTGQIFGPAGNLTSATFATNESTIYGSMRVQTTGTSSSSNYAYVSFNDAGTAQCTIRWNFDGSIGLYTGGPTGTLIQTFTSIFSNAVWNSYQFKIIIHPTAGEITVRMNGSPTNAVSRTGINTRSTSNSTANGFTIAQSTSTTRFDDIYFNNTSGNQPTSWPGDLRAFQQIPVANTQTVFTPVIPTTAQTISTNASNVNLNANVTGYVPFFPLFSGTISSVILSMNANFTGNVKIALYDSTGTGGLPGTALTTLTLNNPVSGDNTISTSISIVYGNLYYLGFDQDATANYKSQAIGTAYSGTTTYASFPVNNPSGLAGPIGVNIPATRFVYTAVDNVPAVEDLIQDGDTSYVFTNSTGEDKYSLKAISSIYNVVMVQPYMFYRRSDVGPRTLALSLTANGSADTAVITDGVVGNSAYNYRFATLELDPTGVAWTVAHVNGAILGLTAG